MDMGRFLADILGVEIWGVEKENGIGALRCRFRLHRSGAAGLGGSGLGVFICSCLSFGSFSVAGRKRWIKLPLESKIGEFKNGCGTGFPRRALLIHGGGFGFGMIGLSHSRRKISCHPISRTRLGRIIGSVEAMLKWMSWIAASRCGGRGWRAL
jgi:hypothetical protein